MANNYKVQNEGKYTTLHDYTSLSLVERAYFSLSPTTVVLRRLFNVLDKYANTNKKKNFTILDVGCGGGMKDLTKYGNVYGLDISESSLQNAKKIYKKAIAADLSKKYPFKDETFDMVFCSEVIGHIAKKDKDHFLNEVKRVLKKDGFFLFSCETEGKNWLTDYLRKRNQYKALWVDVDGHIGLETPQDTLQRFKSRFKDVQYEVNNTYIFTIDELSTIFPSISKAFSNVTIRRIGNILSAPVYQLSLKVKTLSSANNILIYGKK